MNGGQALFKAVDHVTVQCQKTSGLASPGHTSQILMLLYICVNYTKPLRRTFFSQSPGLLTC